MPLVLRKGIPKDALVCGRICYEAFKAIAEQHNFPPDLPNAEHAVSLLTTLLEHPDFYAVVAERDGQTAGSNFLDERGPIAGVGPITVDPRFQNAGIGRELMGALIKRSGERAFAGTRLVQAGYHTRSLSLYLKLGFDVREHLSCVQGPAINQRLPGYRTRPAAMSDLDACNKLCVRVHGHHREGEVREAIARGMARVVERAGRITGYATSIAFFAHAVAENNDDLKALITAAPAFGGPGFLVPSRNGDLMRWCLSKGLRVVQPMTLMTIGLYNEPAGAWLPSILY